MTFDSVLLNVAIIILPICLFEIFGNGYASSRGDQKQSAKGRWFVAAANVLTAWFCAAHPIVLYGHSFDLRLVPFLLAFIYGSPLSAAAVAASIVIYEYAFEPARLTFIAAAYGLMTAICTLVSARTGKQIDTRYTYPLLISSLCLGTMIALGGGFSLINHDRTDPRVWLYFLFYYVLHLGLIWLIALILEYIDTNAVLNQKLIRAEKLNVLSELAAAVAHEIRNPMTVARGFMQLLSRSEVNEEKKQTYTLMVIEEIDRAEKIINDYLSFAKPQAQNVKPLDLREALQKSIQLVTPYSSTRGVEVQYGMEHTRMLLLADMDRLVQSIVNICKYGIDAMPGGGMLRITLDAQPDHLLLQVRDQGDGMTQEEISRLGTPYYTMDTEGTGLSMMVAYRIVESLHGQVQVQSTPAEGSTFTISFPRIQP